HVIFPFRIALGVAWKVLRRRHALSFSPEVESVDADAVNSDVDLMRLTHTDDVVVELTPQADPDDVLAIGGEMVPNNNSALRAEWQVFAHPIVLAEIHRNTIEGVRAGFRISNGEQADRQRSGQIAFQ